MHVEQPSSIIPGIAHRLCPCGFALSPSLICSVILPMGLCLVPRLQWVILYYPLRYDMLSIMPLRISPFINSVARSPRNHKSQLFNADQWPSSHANPMYHRRLTPSISSFKYIILSDLSPPVLSGAVAGSNCSTRPGIEIGNENPVESRVDSPLAAPHFRAVRRSGRMLVTRAGYFMPAAIGRPLKGYSREDKTPCQYSATRARDHRLDWTSLDSLFRGINHRLTTPSNY